jgi:hypothetical protein
MNGKIWIKASKKSLRDSSQLLNKLPYGRSMIASNFVVFDG